jgi:hypothetical protein
MATRTDPGRLLGAADPRDAIAARLRRIADRLRQAENEPELIAMADALEHILAGDLDAAEALGLDVVGGREDFRAWARRRRRDLAYCELAAKVAPGESIAAAARVVAALVARYAATGWRRDAREGAPPPGAEYERALLFKVLSAGPKVVDARQLRRLLVGHATHLAMANTMRDTTGSGDSHATADPDR